MTELERELLSLRHDVAWPPTPDLEQAVRARIAREPAPGRRAAWPRRRPGALATAAAVAVAALLVFAVVLAASSRVRATVKDWLGIGSVAVRRVDRLPKVAPGQPLSLGRAATLSEAGRHLGHPVATVRALGAPDAVYIGNSSVPSRVSLVYAARPGLPVGRAGVGALLDELDAASFPYVQKLVSPGMPIVRVRVNGARGGFIAGAHAVVLPDELRPRIAGNTLIWAARGVTYRLETALGLQAALRLARSVR